jgi:hypothetical protein
MNTSRRSFVKGLGAAAVATTIAKPFFVHAEDKADAKALVTGKEAHQYEVIDHWAKLPDGYKFGNTHGVAETADGQIIVHHQGGGPESICIFDPDGKFIRSWGKEYNGGAHGLQLRKEEGGEFLYLAATGQHFVVKTDLDGKVIFKIEYPREAKNAKGEPCYKDAGKFVPTNTAFHPTDGSFYVADGYGSNYVHHYNAKGEYLSTFGGGGSGEGQLSCPHGMWCDSRDAAHPLLAVADRANERISYFDLDGKFVKINKPKGNVYRAPCHFDQRGEYLLCPGLNGVVSILDKENNIYTYLGDNPNKDQWAKNGWPKDKLVPGIFVAPHGAIFSKAGDIYVGEWLNYGRVTKLRHLA